MAEIIHKKRGRKPKNYNVIQPQIENDNKIVESINTDEEKIILHLPITINEINNFDNNDTSDNSLFIKLDKEPNMVKIQSYNNIINDTDSTDSLKTPINNNNYNKMSINTVQKISTHNLHFTQNTKCWWCRSCFNTPSLELPEDYYNDTFFCIGNFCSFNCIKKYNLELNDHLIWKRDSLINLFYYKIHKNYKEITPAPHWMILKEYGGCLTIEEFRNNFIINSKEYIILHPPLISRQMQIEESYNIQKLKEVPIDNLNRIYSDMETEYTIKRSNPIKSDQLNLEKTMGLIKKKKSNN
jgi:hypothetical protein